MNDQPASDSYVHSYQPPANNDSAPVFTSMPSDDQAVGVVPTPAPTPAPTLNTLQDVPPMSMPPSFEPTPAATDPMQPPVMTAPALQADPTVSGSPAPEDAVRSVSQTLEDQNIFFLLGVTEGSDEDREAFLDELQQVIWEDFVENDVELLITEEEMVGFRQIMQKGDSPEVQEEMIVYLEKLIPDLEEIMLEKALELKEDMVRERIAGMREYFAAQADKLSTINQAEELVNSDQWRAAAELLNSLK